MVAQVKVGVIGAGRIGRLHAEHLAYRIPGARLAGIADISLEAARSCAEACRVPLAVDDARTLLENPEIEAVVICSSTDTHASLIREAAAAKKHVFCEKPIDLDPDRIRRTLHAVQEAGVKLQVGFNRRFDADFRRVRELVAAGRVGTPHTVRITSRDPAPPPLAYIKVSGGIFLDMTVHDFDMARYLLREDVVEVYAAGGVMVDPEIGAAGDLDTCVVTLRFAGGAVGIIENSRKAVYGYDQRVEVFGSGGKIETANHTADTAVRTDAEGVHGPLPLPFFVERYRESYLAEMGEFIECVRTDREPEVSGRDGLLSVLLGHAALQSFRENRPVPVQE